ACSGPDTHTRDGDGLFMITPPPPEHPAPAKDSINPNGRPDYAEDPHHCEPPDQTQRPSTRHNPGLGIFQATGSSKPSEDSLPQPPYIVLDAAPIHGAPIEDLAFRSVHRDGVQLAHRF